FGVQGLYIITILIIGQEREDQQGNALLLLLQFRYKNIIFRSKKIGFLSIKHKKQHQAVAAGSVDGE
ncbi:hypothetical protein ACJX0J_019911, partial [Zea mays]